MKKFYISAVSALAAAAGLLGIAKADTFSFSLPSSTVSDLSANVGSTVTSVWVLVAIALGIPLAFYIIRKVISLIPKK